MSYKIFSSPQCEYCGRFISDADMRDREKVDQRSDWDDFELNDVYWFHVTCKEKFKNALP